VLFFLDDTLSLQFMQNNFVHLHLHTEYSLVDGIVRIKPLFKMAEALRMPAIAITDQSNLFAIVKFYRAAQASGIKPIFGSDVWLVNEENRDKPYRTVFLCQTYEGYLNLTRLVSRSYQHGQHRGIAMIEFSWLKGATDGLIVLLGPGSDVGQQLINAGVMQAHAGIQKWQELFPERLYLEIMRTGREAEEDHLHAAVELAGISGLPVVASNDVHFLNSSDFEAHEARVCINEGRVLSDSRRPRRFSEQQYFRSPEEMQELFSDIPEAIENTLEIAKRCNVELTLGKNYLPDFPVPTGMSMAEYFGELSREGLEKRLEIILRKDDPDYVNKRKVYDERLQVELDVINNMGFPGYFLIVADFIKWAKDNGIPVGPGRGSGAGSLVAYALTITDLDPIEYDLLFERFLNPERVSMPDFDIDFCMDNRDQVIAYVARRYGKEKVSQIITYGSMAAKAVVRDCGRVLDHPYGFTDRLAKLIPFEIGITLSKALEQEEQLRNLYDEDEDVKDLIDLALSLEGITRNAGKHAGGVVIAPTALTDFAALYCDEDGNNLVTQFDKDDVEAVGLVKFDFLGLRTLTIIDWALKAVNRRRKDNGEEALDISLIPLDDKATFDLLKASQTTAVFQLESRGMKDLIKRLQPDNFEDIIALVALFRPGPLQSGMVDDFINRKHGRAKVVYDHPDIGPVLKPTYGVILYQEQVMQIAQVLAGYSLGGADMLRRAMGKKKPEEMEKQRAIFTEGCLKNNIDAKTATGIFDLMEKFAGYGFNKSHSAAYALVSYQTAWMKAHYPAEFMAAVMSADMDNTDKVVLLVEECKQMKIKLHPPCVNRSDHHFCSTTRGEVIYGLGAVKGVGESAIEAIVAERDANGLFTDMFEFCKRVNLKKLNRRSLETLINCGALDALGPNRATMMNSLTAAIQMADQHTKNSAAGMSDMFGFATLKTTDHTQEVAETRWSEVPEWDDRRRLGAEKDSLGLYLTGHPIDMYRAELKRYVSARIANLQADKNRKVTVAGLLVGVRVIKTKRGSNIGILTLDDKSGKLDVTLFSEALENYRDLLKPDSVIIVSGEVSIDDFSGGLRMQAKEVYDVDGARGHFCRRMIIHLNEQRLKHGTVQEIANTLAPYKNGECPVFVRYSTKKAHAGLRFGEQWRVKPTEDLLSRLKTLVGAESVSLEF